MICPMTEFNAVDTTNCTPCGKLVGPDYKASRRDAARLRVLCATRGRVERRPGRVLFGGSAAGALGHGDSPFDPQIKLSAEAG